MKKLRISFILLAVMITFVGGMFFTSCEKENALVDRTNNREANIEEIENVENYDNLTVADMPQLEVKDGMLYFDNSEQYFKTIAIVTKMSDQELDNWEQQLGFVSLRTMQNKVMDILLDFETEEELFNYVNQNSNLLQITTDKNGEKYINEIVHSTIISSISNEQGVYSTKSKVHKVIGDIIITTNHDNLQELITISNKNECNSNFEVESYITEITDEKKPKYRSMKGEDADLTKGRCYKHRRARIKQYIQNLGYNDYGTYRYAIFVNVEVKGWAKSVVCVWCAYKTRYSFKSVYGTVRYHKNGYYKNYSIPSKSSSRDEYKLRDYRTIVSGTTSSYQSLDDYSNKNYIWFTKIRGEGSSRGVGDKWSVINYDY